MRISLGPHELDLEVSAWNTQGGVSGFKPLKAPGHGTTQGGVSGPPLVVLHGFLEQGAAWQWVAEGLKRPVYAPDQRGHGRSEHVGRGGFYHFWDYVSDLDLLLEKLHPDGPVDLLGHSMGGTVACLYAGCRPERVSRLVLVEGLGPPDTAGSLVARARIFLEHRREPHTNPTLPDVESAAARMLRHNPKLGEARAHALAERSTVAVDGGVTWTWDPLHRARSPRPFVEGHFVPFLEEITAPTLVVWGAKSPFPGVERAKHLRDATVVSIPDAGHLVHLDAPDLLAAEIERFLA
ncbi:MAG: alpha/beta hydrolase [Alphaproteobacteria bacterium]|nr:alpha/beta hydrolase [Alphaproteobacteria bacterium]